MASAPSDDKNAICRITYSIHSEREIRKASDQSVSDEKVISDATDFVNNEKDRVNNSIENFNKKGLFGLWWDAKGLFNSSKKGAVLNDMTVYNEINEKILKCIELAANDDDNAYQEILALYKRIQNLKTTAEKQANGQSKALCVVAKNFLDNHIILNHHLKQVECVVLGTDVRELKESVAELQETATQGIRNFDRVLNENRELKNSVRILKEENETNKQQMAILMEDNKVLKKFLSDRFPGQF